MTKSQVDYIDKLLSIAETAAIAGGQHIKQEYFKTTSLEIKEKEKDDFVTNLDVESEQIIRKIIKSSDKEARIIGEEAGAEGTNQDIEWYVDPLDGTGAFIRGNLGFVTVSVSAIDRRTQKILVGAVYNPFTEQLYSASASGQLKLGVKSKINKSVNLSKARILLDVSEDFPLSIRKVLTPDNAKIGRILRYDGSFAQHMCLLATGTLHGAIFWGKGNKGTFWDLAAALLICQTAGLVVTNLAGEPVSKADKTYDQLIVGPKKLHSQLKKWVKDMSNQHGLNTSTSKKTS